MPRSGGMRHALAFASLTLLMPASAWCDAGLDFANAPGPHAVGLRVVQQYDHSRSYKDRIDIVTGHAITGERVRPIQTLIWYPAVSGGRAMRYGDYAALAQTEESFDAPRLAAGTIGRRAGEIRAVAAQPMQAMRDATGETGRFPVVIYAPSFGASAAENADLCEYLASQGYIVIASASMGAHSRAMTGDLEGVETQVDDIEFLIGYTRTLPQVDLERLAVIGFSWGGLANVAAAAKDARIRALVSLDGTIRYDNDTLKAIAWLSAARVTVPLLYVASRAATLEQMNVDRKYYDISRDFLNELKYSDVYIASVAAMAHEDFSSYFLRVRPDEAFDEGYSRHEASVAHAWVGRYVERFLDATLKGDAAARAFLDNDPARNGVPAHFMRMDARRRVAEAPTLENIALALSQRGFDHADDVIHELHLDEAGNEPAEEALDDWAHRALWAGDASRAVHVFQFAVRLHPASAGLNDGLGEAWQAAGDNARAEAAYRAALALEPGHASAARHLHQLTGK